MSPMTIVVFPDRWKGAQEVTPWTGLSARPSTTTLTSRRGFVTLATPSASSTGRPVRSPIRFASGVSAAAPIEQHSAMLMARSQRVIRHASVSETIGHEQDSDRSRTDDHQRLDVPAYTRLHGATGPED